MCVCVRHVVCVCTMPSHVTDDTYTHCHINAGTAVVCMLTPRCCVCVRYVVCLCTMPSHVTDDTYTHCHINAGTAVVCMLTPGCCVCVCAMLWCMHYAFPCH